MIRGEGTRLLLEQRDQEVDGQHGVGHDLVLLHVDVTDSDGETEHLLQLEFDGRSNLVDLLGQVLTVGNRGGELAGFRETGTQETEISARFSCGGEFGTTDRGICLIKASEARKASYF